MARLAADLRELLVQARRQPSAACDSNSSWACHRRRPPRPAPPAGLPFTLPFQLAPHLVSPSTVHRNLQLDLSDVTVVGASMGCAVVWSYIELFGEERLKQVGWLAGL